MDTRDVQKHIYQNKVDKGFNVTNIEKEICFLHGELAEMYEAYRKHLTTVGEEMADVAIYLLGLAEILNIDLGAEIEKKMDINEHRRYELINGVNTKVSDADINFAIHNMKLNPSPFEKIVSGRKTVELRLYDEKRRKINIGDRIIFTNLGDPEQRIAVKVIGLHRYATFEDLFRNISSEKCGNDRTETPEDVATGMKKYYSDEQIRKYGVLGIEIELTDLDYVLELLEEQRENEFERLFPDGIK